MNSDVRNAKFPSNPSLIASLEYVIAKLIHIIGANCSFMMRLPVVYWRGLHPPVLFGISYIFNWRPPSKITKAIIERITIPVKGYHAFGAWTNKRLQNKSVYLDVICFPVSAKSGKATPIPASDGLNPSLHDSAIYFGPRPLPRIDRADPSKIRNLIARESKDLFPVFHILYANVSEAGM